MPGAGKKKSGQSGTMSSILQFDQKPRRRMLILGAAALVIIAVIAIGIGTLRGGSGCNAALATQRFGCIEALAGQTANPQLCTKIGNSAMEASCIIAVAKDSGNSSACITLLGGRDRIDCVDNVSYSKSDPALCNGLDAANQSLCSYNVVAALNFSDRSYCSGIREQAYQVLCYSQSYYHLALSTGNYSYCGELQPVQNSTLIYAMATQNPSYQSSPTGLFTGFVNTTPRDFCYASLATTKSQASCAYITNSTLRQACGAAGLQSNTTVSIQNITANCASTGSPQLRNLCYFGVYTNEAMATYNESWCGQITNQSYMTTCVVNLATARMNTTYCKALQNASDMQTCVSDVQLASGNYT
jgi:hypothetical protein